MIDRDYSAKLVGKTIIGGMEIIEGLNQDWQRLCDAPPNDLPFCRPEWVEAYFQKQENARFVIALVQEAGKLKGLLPLIQKKRRLSRLPVRMLRGPSELLLWPTDILIDSESNRQAIAGQIWSNLRDHKEWDLIELPVIPKGGVAEDVLKSAENEGYLTVRWEHMHSPVINLSQYAGTENVLQIARSSNLRRNIKQAINKGRREGGLKVFHFDKADAGILQQLYALEAGGWKGQQKSAVMSNEREIIFWNKIAHAAEKYGYLSMHALQLHGKIVAVSMGFRYKNRHFGMKLGIDERLRSYSLGHLLCWANLEDCCRNRINEYHLMGLRSDWKEAWTQSVKPHGMCYIFRKGLFGYIIRAVVRRHLSQTRKLFNTRHEHLESEKLSGQH